LHRGRVDYQADPLLCEEGLGEVVVSK